MLEPLSRYPLGATNLQETVGLAQQVLAEDIWEVIAEFPWNW